MKALRILLVISIILNIFLGFRLSMKNENIQWKERVKIERDTIINIDTVTVEIPIYKEKIKVRTDTLYQILQVDDTTNVEIPIEIPIEQQTYENDSIGKVIIEGYNPQLILWESYRKKSVIKEKETVYRKKHFNYGIQGGLGYGFFNKGFDFYVGFGIQYNF